jgi:CRISPR-associated protein Csx17
VVADVFVRCLKGCTPTPLVSYLKALGLLRLLASASNNVTGEAADPTVRGWWVGEFFCVRTKLNCDALLHFFLEDYAPSPIIAPWNGRAGFLEGDVGGDSNRSGAQLMRAIEESLSPRFRNMRQTIAALRGQTILIQYDDLRAQIKAATQEEASSGESVGDLVVLALGFCICC